MRSNFEYYEGTAYSLISAFGDAGTLWLLTLGHIDFPVSLRIDSATVTPSGVDFDVTIAGLRTRITTHQDMPISINLAR